ncbi:MAG: alpha/beta hydrolase fold domain-containing protein, partial [Pirellulales bacterium]|nr:alpha/beta hydrolase fold domain-containing protein [Pirellulales bacterium]
MSRFHASMSWDKMPEKGQPKTGKDQEITAQTHWKSPDTNESGGIECAPGADDRVLRQAGWNFRKSPQSFFLPLHYEPNYRYPLIVWLHNDGFNENQVEHVMPHISLRNYIAAGVRGVRAADSMGHRFDWHDSPAAFHAAEETVCHTIEVATQQFSVHPQRIVLAGYGSGGTMAMRVAMRRPQRYAA